MINFWYSYVSIVTKILFDIILLFLLLTLNWKSYTIYKKIIKKEWIFLKKYYAVKNGRNIGIYESWEECREQVSGYSGASYKSFLKKEDALNFMENKSENKKSETYAYVDGSFSLENSEFSFGAVIFNKGDVFEFCEKFSDPELISMRNVAGEIKGAEFVMKYCVENKIKSVDIYYDYMGIEKWCTGEWKANKTGTIAYRNYYNSIKEKLNVNFIKVKGHSGDKFNDLADKLAKSALGIK